MFTAQIILLSSSGLIGLLANWLLILAIQRKTYHHQEAQRLPVPSGNNSSLLRPKTSLSAQVVRPPLLPSARSSISTFDKYILSLLVNDIFTCNLLLPLRLIELTEGLPSVFLCFTLKFFERLTTVTELIIISLLVVTSLIFFTKKRLFHQHLSLIGLLILSPLIIIYIGPSLIYLDTSESNAISSLTCRESFLHLSLTSSKTLNILSCLSTYLLLAAHAILLFKMKRAIKEYTLNSLKRLTEARRATRHRPPEIYLADQQNPLDAANRRSASVAVELTPTPSVTTQRSLQTFDYITHLTVIENGQTLIQSTYLLLMIDALVYIPYWTCQLLSLSWSMRWKDLFYLSHLLKPFCYLSTNEQYRYHALAILQCKPFRLLPKILRQRCTNLEQAA